MNKFMLIAIAAPMLALGGQIAQDDKPLSEYQLAVNNGSAKKLSAGQVNNSVCNAIVKIYTEDAAGNLFTATGFFVTSTTVLTNYHVVDGITKIGLEFRDGRIIYGAKEIATDKINDIAIIETTHSSSSWVKIVPDSNWEHVGEKVFLLGFPNGKALMTEGEIDVAARDGFLTSALIDHGSSGSPVFNEYGRAIGMVCSVNETTHKSMAVSMNMILAALSN